MDFLNWAPKICPNWPIFCKKHTDFDRIKEENGLITAFLKNPLEASVLNQKLFAEGIVLTHLVKRKESLEEQFLQLTNSLN